MSSFYKYIPESLSLFAVALPVYIPPSVVISHLPSVFVLHLCLICPLQHCFPIPGFPGSKFTTFHIPIVQKYGMISAEARTIQTVLFHNCLERKKKHLQIRKSRNKGERETTTHVQKDQCGMLRWRGLWTAEPRFKGQLHFLVTVWCWAHHWTSLNFNFLTYTKRQYDDFISNLHFKGSNLNTLPKWVCYFAPFEGVWLFGVPESSGKGRAWPSALNLRMWLSSPSDISWKRGHGCCPPCSKAYRWTKITGARGKVLPAGHCPVTSCIWHLCSRELPEVSSGKAWAALWLSPGVLAYFS